MWSIVNAKSHLSEILRRARAGEPQVIGTQASCVVVSMEDYEAKMADHDGAWLLRQVAKLDAAISLPSRGDDRNDKIFE